MRMLEEQQVVGTQALLAFRRQLLLHFERRPVADQPEFPDRQLTH